MSRRLPPLNALRSFEAAARSGSFKDAADELNVSQSAVSHQIKHLEESLGVELFVRRARSVELTPAGRSYFPILREAFDHIGEGTRMLLRSQQDDVLAIQMYSTFAVRWLMPRLERFQRKHPEIQVRLSTSQWDADFSAQDIDLALMIGEPNNPALHFEYLFSPTLFPVCSPRLLNSHKTIRKPADLAGHTILQVYPSDRDWRTWLNAVGVDSVDPNAGLSFDSYDHALKTAARGQGVALAMQPYVSEDLAAGLLVNPFPDIEVSAGAQWYLCYPIGRARIRKIRVFQSWLLEEVDLDAELAALRREPDK